MRVADGLTRLETALGHPLDRPRALPVAASPRPPLEALEEAIAPSLAAVPCFVAFSGGRDSSLVLAAAVRASDRHSLPRPVPLTLRYPGLADADETEWQELVMSHLGLDDWLRLEVRDDLDLVGSLAQEVLAALGPTFPANAHSLVPMVRAAEGGTLLLGLGGDELFIGNRWTPLNHLLAGRRRPNRRDPIDLALAALPGPARSRVLRSDRTVHEDRGWLTPTARAQFERLRRALPADPVPWRSAMLAGAGGTTLRLAVQTLSRLGGLHGVEVRTPLLAPTFLGSLARTGGRFGWGGRTAAMRTVAAGALPDEVLARAGKAAFTNAFFGPSSRAFADDWSGQGLDSSLVDPDAIRAAWRAPTPDFRSALLLQSAWLHDRSPVAVATR